MFAALFAKEIKEQLQTFRFGAALITTFVLVVLSVWVLGDDYQRRLNAYNLAVERNNTLNDETYLPAWISPTLHRQPSVLSIFAQGEDRRFGNSVKVQRWVVPSQATGSFNDNLLLAAQNPLDLYTIFALVVSLFGVLFSYDAIAGERERGTLKLLITGRAGRGTIFAAKFVAGFSVLAIPFLISFLSGLIVLVFFFQLSLTAVQWTAVGLMVLTGIIYGSLFIAMGLACSAIVRTPAVALIFALFLWALGVLVIPTTSSSIAGALIEIPSRSPIDELEKATFEETETKRREFAKDHPNYGSGWTGGWGTEKYYLFDGNVIQHQDTAEYVRFYEPLMQARAEQIWNEVKKQEDVKIRQAEMAGMIGFLAPAQHLRNAFTALTGTAVHAHQSFLEMARKYRRGLLTDFENQGFFGRNAMRFFSRRDASDIDDDLYIQRMAGYRALAASGDPNWYKTVGPESWGKLPRGTIPQFSFKSGVPDFEVATAPILILITMTAVLFMAGVILFVRYDVR